MISSSSLCLSFLFCLISLVLPLVNGDEFLNVFVVPHSHDDVGWVQSIEEYYETQVRYIYDSTVASLIEDPSRTFIYVEQAYFSRWWKDNRTSDQQRQQFTQLLQKKQIEFVIGGWVMHDEAVVTYSAAIDQMTEGHQFIQDLFGQNYNPTLGWQIDPFGASSVTPTLNSLFNFSAHVIARIPWQEQDEMMNTQTMEFNWIGSKNLKTKTQMFSHCLWESYCQPGATFDYDNGVVVLPDDADNLVAYIRKRSLAYRTTSVLIPWGCDFRWTNASRVYASLDQLIAYINSHSAQYQMELRYTKLSEYFASVKEVSGGDYSSFPTLEYSDFYPYIERDASYWTGYFSSHPALKSLTRTSESFLKSVDAIYSLARENDESLQSDFSAVSTLRQAIAETQHHDGVTGTEKNYVANMYTNDINSGLSVTAELTEETLSTILGGNSSFAPGLTVSADDQLLTLESGKVIAVVLYNQLGWTRKDYISVSITPPQYQVIVTDAQGNVVGSDLNPSFFANSAKFDVWFFAEIPPLGSATYFLSLDLSTPHVPPKFVQIVDDLVIQNSFMEVHFSNTTGRLSQIKNLKSGISTDVDQNVFAYQSGYYEGQASGAYIFLPVDAAQPISNSPVQTYVLRDQNGQLHGDYVRLVYQTWVTPDSTYMQHIYVLKVSDDELVGNHLLSLSLIGVIPQGYEMVSRFTTSLQTGTTFYTDSEGFEMQTRNWDPTKDYKYTANYYPAVYSAYIEEPTFSNSPRLTLVFDSTHGVSSQGYGTLEAMVHRSCLLDDQKGVEEVLNDTTVIAPSIYINFETRARAAYFRHQLEYLKNFSPLIAIGTTSSVNEWTKYYKSPTSGLSADLPRNIHLLSFKALNGNTSKNIVRLAHIFELDEDETYSKPVVVDVRTLFAGRTIASCVETTLSANSQIGTNCRVIMRPKDIKTFLVEFS